LTSLLWKLVNGPIVVVRWCTGNVTKATHFSVGSYAVITMTSWQVLYYFYSVSCSCAQGVTWPASKIPKNLAEDYQLLTDIGCHHCDQLMSWDVPQKERISETGVFPSLDRVSGTLSVTLRDRDISLVQFKRLLKTLWFV